MGCRYCDDIFSTSSPRETGVWNSILFESEHFVAVPTIGALIEGWLLIITKRHYLCMGEIPDKLVEELDQFKCSVVQAVEDCFGPVAIFEHGPSEPKQAVGCGVDHAHLHIVPTDCDILRCLPGVLADDLQWAKGSGLRDARKPHSVGLEYLYVEQPIGQASLASSRGFESQLFRRVIAHYLGVPDRYDWKLHSGAENIRRTVDRITRWLDQQGLCVGSGCPGTEVTVR